MVDFKKAIKTKRGKYGGGTYAHPTLALDFLLWCDPRLKPYLYLKIQDQIPELIKYLVEISQTLPPLDNKRAGYLYLIQNEESDKFKIGVTANLDERLKSLQTANPNKLNYILYKFYENAYEIEREAHLYLESNKISGEWFILTDEELKRVCNFYFS